MNGDRPPDRINGYEILGVIGRGGMGVVYRARQVSIDRLVALKVLSPRLARDHLFARRLLEEARASARLDHPNIVKAIDAGEADGFHYFAMEHVSGKDLGRLLAETGALPPERALDIAVQIARALAYAAARNTVHLDLKPSNILLTDGGVPKLADFGLARRLAEQGAFYTEKKMLFGTPRYMSPEHLSGSADLDSRSDIYSLGVTLYEMLAGTPPYPARKPVEVAQQVKSGRHDPLSERAPHLPKDLCAVVERMMAHDRAQRYADVETLLADLEALQKGVPPVYVDQTAPEPTEEPPVLLRPPPRGPRRWAVIAAGAIAWLLLAAGVLAPLAAGWAARRARAAVRLPPSPEGGTYRRETAYRQALLAAEALCREGRFGEALEAVETVPEPDRDALAGRFESLRSRVLRAAQDEVQRCATEAEAHLAAGRFDAARAAAQRLRSIGAEGAADRARRLSERIAQAEEDLRRRAQTEAARAAYQALQAEVEALVAECEYLKAIAACDRFLDEPDHASYHPSARALRAPLERIGGALRAALAGARAGGGRHLSALDAIIVGVEDDRVLLRSGPREQSVRPQDLSGDALEELARFRGRLDGPFHVGAAEMLVARARSGRGAAQAAAFRDALAQIGAARRAGGLDAASRAALDELEAEALFASAAFRASAGEHAEALRLLDTLRARLPHTRWLRDHAAAVEQAARAARHELRLASGMAFVPAGKTDILRGGTTESLEVGAFYIDRCEVTVRDYARFLDAVARGGVRRPLFDEEPPDKDFTPLSWQDQLRHPSRPVVGVDWYDARAYAAWAGKSLPSETQWEKAARGPKHQRYPWGATWDPVRANSAARADEGGPALMDADSLPESAGPYGCLHMSGNAREWTATRSSGSRTLIVVKGGSFAGSPGDLSLYDRKLLPLDARDMETGFRCCIEAD